MRELPDVVIAYGVSDEFRCAHDPPAVKDLKWLNSDAWLMLHVSQFCVPQILFALRKKAEVYLTFAVAVQSRANIEHEDNNGETASWLRQSCRRSRRLMCTTGRNSYQKQNSRHRCPVLMAGRCCTRVWGIWGIIWVGGRLTVRFFFFLISLICVLHIGTNVLMTFNRPHQ